MTQKIISDLEMPFLLRLFLQTENQVGTHRGSECSGTIIDNHWIATSFDCCKDIVAFRLMNFGRGSEQKANDGENIGISKEPFQIGQNKENSRKVNGHGHTKFVLRTPDQTF